jgi:hypothetical protein
MPCSIAIPATRRATILTSHPGSITSVSSSTLDLNSVGDKEKDPLGIENFRTASIDLDCVYGLGPNGSRISTPAIPRPGRRPLP